MAENLNNKKIESQIDRLYQDVKAYRNSNKLYELMKFCREFRYLAPFNAMLLNMQKPAAQFVLSAYNWKERYNRGIKLNARPLILMLLFGPVEFVFDISDTYSLESSENDSKDNKRINEILEELQSPYKTKGNVDDKLLYMLIDNLKYHGIVLEKMEVGGYFAGKIQRCNRFNLSITLLNNIIYGYNSSFVISVNNNAEKGEMFATICHELAHLFCHHIKHPDDEKGIRELNVTQEEFEAETVSWLICERLNIHNPSEEYLSNYINKNKELPEISIEHILKATNKIERMFKSMSYKDGLVYKHDKEFKKFVDSIVKKKKKSKNEQTDLFNQ